MSTDRWRLRSVFNEDSIYLLYIVRVAEQAYDVYMYNFYSHIKYNNDTTSI